MREREIEPETSKPYRHPDTGEALISAWSIGRYSHRTGATPSHVMTDEVDEFEQGRQAAITCGRARGLTDDELIRCLKENHEA